MKTGIAARFGLAGAAIVAGGLLIGSSAGAAVVPETGEPGLLWLEADPYPADSFVLARGERVLWPVTANLDATSSGELTLEVAAAEPLATDVAGVRIEVAECGEPWEVPAGAAAVCSTGDASIVIAETPVAAVADGRRWSLGVLAPGVPRHFLATMSLPLSTPGSLAAESATIGLGFQASDVEDPPPALAETGLGIAGPLLLAIGVLLAGSAANALRRAS